VVAVLALTVTVGMATVGAQPDPRQMSGVPLPVGDLPSGTVTVRVIRGSLANPVASQTVEISGANGPKQAVTNESGRAEFAGLPAGARVRAVAVVAGERLESQEFAVPASGGVRLMLVAADPGGPRPVQPPPAAASAPPGEVVLSEETRFVFEAGEDGLSVFYILQIQNSAATPVQPPQPVVFQLPSDARGAALLEGSSPQATVAGREVKIAGPFAPGRTLVQVAYTMPYGDANLDIEQQLPLRLMHLAIVAQKIGDMRLASPQVTEQRDMPAQGNLYIAARGGPVAAGEVLRFSFSGMPHHATWPRTLALALAVAVLGGGAWSAMRAGSATAPYDVRRQELEATRDRLFDELTALEQDQQRQAVDPDRYAGRRRELIEALERVYAALDDDAVAVGRA
jgi:hypothetical protein